MSGAPPQSPPGWPCPGPQVPAPTASSSPGASPGLLRSPPRAPVSGPSVKPNRRECILAGPSVSAPLGSCGGIPRARQLTRQMFVPRCPAGWSPRRGAVPRSPVCRVLSPGPEDGRPPAVSSGGGPSHRKRTHVSSYQHCSPTRPCPGDPPAASPWGPGSQCESGEEPYPPQPGLLAAPLTQRASSPASPRFWLSRGGAARPPAQPSPEGLLQTGYRIQTSLKQAHLLSYFLLFVFLESVINL